MASFGFQTTGAEIVAAFPEQVEGKTFVITGPSINSLGAQTAKFLAAGRPAELLLLGRTESKITPVIDAIKAINPSTKVLFIQLDLGNFASIRKAASEVSNAVPKIDVLLNNAGIMAPEKFALTDEGLESQFGANHIGHFLLTNLLTPKLLAAGPGARVVNVSSDGFTLGQMQFENYNFDGGKTYDRWSGYGQSKTANMLFTKALAGKLGSQGIESFSLHPGKIKTNLGLHVAAEEWPGVADRFIKAGANERWKEPCKTIEQGTSTILRAVLDPSLKNSSGAFLCNCNIDTNLPEYTTSPELADKLWKLSEKIVGQEFAY